MIERLNHIAIAVPVRCGTEIQRVIAVQQSHEFMGVDLVGVRVTSAKIRQRHAIDDGSGGRPEAAFEYLFRVGARHRMHCVKTKGEPAGQQISDPAEIENITHQFCVIGHRIDDLHAHIFEP